MYPIGVPLLYAFILWKNRHLLNPTLAAAARAEQGRQAEEGKESDEETEGVDQSNTDGQRRKHLSPLEEEELEKMVKLRRTNPELVPSMFLWKDFGETLFSVVLLHCAEAFIIYHLSQNLIGICTACAVLLRPQWLTTIAAISLGLLREGGKVPLRMVHTVSSWRDNSC